MFFLQSWLFSARESTSGYQDAERLALTSVFSRFSAMPKLVDESELAVLSRQPGFDARLIRQLRSVRRRAFRLYLSEIAAEFRTHARESLDRAANDPGVDPAFTEAVVKAKTRFEVSLFLLRASTFLPAFTTDRTRRWTVDLLDSMRVYSS